MDFVRSDISIGTMPGALGEGGVQLVYEEVEFIDIKMECMDDMDIATGKET